MAGTTMRSTLIRVYNLGISFFYILKEETLLNVFYKGHYVYSPNKLKKLKLK